jgi:hypothetical protein
VALGYARPISIANNSFEIPVIDPVENPFLAMPVVPGWIEQDIDPEPEYGGRNTGIFLNTLPDSNDHIINPDGSQLAFLGSYQGNALLQNLTAVYQVGRQYRLSVGVCFSLRYPPVDSLTLALYYYTDPNVRTDIKSIAVSPAGLTATQLVDFSVTLPPVQPDDAWVGKNIGIAIRANGAAGGFWDLDNVRLTELAGDFTGDGVVNLSDLQILAEYWLDSL